MIPGPDAVAGSEQQTAISTALGAETPPEAMTPSAGPVGPPTPAPSVSRATSPSPGALEPPTFVGDPAKGEVSDAGPPLGVVDRHPEIGLAGGFAGGFLLAAILRRLGR